jgi:serine---pyruvate transaminase
MPPLPTRHVLLTPGPTPLPMIVAAAQAGDMPHHRSPEFAVMLARVLDRLKRVYRTNNDVILFSASATSAMESAVVNLLSRGDRVLVVSAGNFGERWVRMSEVYTPNVDVLRYPWGAQPDPAEVAARIQATDNLAAVIVTHSETSTGATADVRRIAEMTRERSAMLVVDAVSSLGAAELDSDGWGLDVVISGSQKALMAPPGLAFASVSRRALARAATSTTPRFTLDWRRALDAQAKHQTPATPAITLVMALDAALELFEANGLDASICNTTRLGGAVRRAMRALGLELFSPDRPDCSLVTAVRWPDGVDGDAVRRAIRERHAITIAGGQGELAGRIFRIGAFGAISPNDLTAGISALEVELLNAGHVVELGRGVGAFTRAYEEASTA